jgi:hypothetical protein
MTKVDISTNRIAAAPKPPVFLITIDTEGDNLWANPSEIRTENSRFLPRFQSLCEKYGLKPTYLTNFEMANCDRFVEFGRDAVRRRRAEIGMHLHAWNSPPITGASRRAGMPYLIEFHDAIMTQKVKFMTSLLNDRFEREIVSHRAGRWALNESYARILVEHGYLADCSVTPHVSWRMVKGFEDGDGGADYRGFPSEPYFISLSDIGVPGASSLLEVPMTVVPQAGITAAARWQSSSGLIQRAARRLLPAARWFRPNGRNLGSMRNLLRQRKHSKYIEFMLHSSELMPGGSPTFRTERSIELLYDHLEILFAEAQADYRAATLAEFRAEFETCAGGSCNAAGAR